MKKTTTLLLASILTMQVFSQVNTSINADIKAGLLKKSRTQKIIGFSLIGVGLIFDGLYLQYGVTGFAKEIIGDQESHKADRRKANAFLLTGTVLQLSSIPLFVGSHKNKQKAISLGLTNQYYQLPGKQNYTTTMVPSFSILLNL